MPLESRELLFSELDEQLPIAAVPSHVIDATGKVEDGKPPSPIKRWPWAPDAGDGLLASWSAEAEPPASVTSKMPTGQVAADGQRQLWDTQGAKLQFLVVDDTPGQGLRLTDYASKGPGDSVLFAELQIPGTATTDWIAISYRQLCRDLHIKDEHGSGPDRRWLREQLTPAVVATGLGMATPRDAVDKMRKPPKGLTGHGLHPHQLLSIFHILSVLEHRNYRDREGLEGRGGARHLPHRLVAAVTHGRLDASDLSRLGDGGAADIVSGSGAPGVLAILPEAVWPAATTEPNRAWWKDKRFRAPRQ